MVDNCVIGRRIGAYLKLTGRKNGWLGEQMGWNHERTSTILNGKRRIEVVEFFKICKILGVSYQQFVKPEDYED